MIREMRTRRGVRCDVYADGAGTPESPYRVWLRLRTGAGHQWLLELDAPEAEELAADLESGAMDARKAAERD